MGVGGGVPRYREYYWGSFVRSQSHCCVRHERGEHSRRLLEVRDLVGRGESREQCRRLLKVRDLVEVRHHWEGPFVGSQSDGPIEVESSLCYQVF